MRIKKKFSILLAILLLIFVAYLESLNAQVPRCCLFIGTSVSMTGAFASIGTPFKESFLLWENEINKAGGIADKLVKFVLEDDKSNPSIASSIYNRLITVDKVNFLFGHYNSSLTSAVSPIAEKYRCPMIVFGAPSPVIWQRGYKYIFQVYPDPNEYFTNVIKIASKFGLKRLSTLSSDNWLTKTVALTAKEFAEREGMNIVSFNEYHMGTHDFSPYLMRIKQLEPDIIIGSTSMSEAVFLMRQLKDFKISPSMIALGNVASEEFYRQLGKNADYVLGYSIWEDFLKTPGNQDFTNAYEKMWGHKPDYHAAGAWAMCQVLEQAIKKAGTLDREEVRTILSTSALPNILPGEFKVDPGGKNIGNKGVIIQWKAGEKEVVWPANLATGEIKFLK